MKWYPNIRTERNIRTGEHVLRKIARNVEENILRRWLEGNSQRQVASEFRVGLATVNRVIQDAKKGTPDIDDLRQLNMALQKSGITVVDAVRACSILSGLDEMGIGTNELAQYVELSKKLAIEHGVGAAELVESAIRLSKLEKETGKPYHEIVREFDDKQAGVKELDLKAKEMNIESIRIQGELSQAKEKLSKTLGELKRATGCQDRLQRLQLNKINALAEFIEDYEIMGFNAQEVKRLADWRKSLAKIGIDPDRLESFIEKKGSLEKQLRSLEVELSQGKARLKILAAMERETQDIQRIRNLMDMKKAFSCGYCGSQFFHELRRFEVSQCLATDQPIIVNCLRCGASNQYNPREVLARLGFEVLS